MTSIEQYEVVYEDAEEEEININNVEGEIEVDSHHEEWMIPMGEQAREEHPEVVQKSALPAPGIVLKTIDDLRVHPRIHVSCGKRPTKHFDSSSRADVNPEDYPDDHDPNEPGTSSIPPIRAALRMFANAALRNADSIRLVDVEEDLDECVTDNEEDREETARRGKRGQVTFSHRNWPLYNDRPIDYQEACEILCGALEVDKKLICTTIPQGFKNEGTFIVDLRNMRNRHDVHGDGLGSWGKPTGRVRYYSRHKDGSSRIVRADDGKGKILRGSKYVWKCMLKRYEHPSTSMVNNGANRFIKKIYTALYPAEMNKAVGLAIVSYEWMGREPFDFSIATAVRPAHRRPHGSVPPHGTWETSSFQNRLPGALPSTMSGFFGDIPIYAVGAVDFNTAASIILGGIVVEPAKIAHSVPLGYRDAGTFVIDTEYLATDALLRRDDNGIWGKPAGTSRYYVIDANNGDAIRIDTNNKLPPDQVHDIQILCKRYEHPQVDGRFVRKIYTGRTAASSTVPHRINLAVISYFWKGEPAPFETRRQNQVVMAEGRYTEEDYPSYSSEQLEPSTSVAPEPKRRKPDEKDNRVHEGQSEKDFRHMVWKKEYENQVRFSALLDRAEGFISRLERATGNVLYTQENHEGHQEWVQRDAVSEEVVVSNNGEEEGQFES